MATIGDPEYIKECKALFICGTPFASTKGMDGLLTSNFKKAQELLKEAGYDGTPDRADALDRPEGADQPRAGRQIADGEGGLQGRHAVDGLADGGRAPRQEGPAQCRRLERVPDRLGRRRRDEPGVDGLSELVAATRRCSAGRAMPSWKSCATISHARPTRPSRRRSPRRCSCAASRSTPEIPVGEYVQPVAMRKNVKGFVDCAGAGVLEHRSHQVS